MSLNNKYAIVAPGYRVNSGGIRTLHRLCHDINKLGGDAEIVPISTDDCNLNGSWNTRLCTDLNNRIVIYPEIVKGNPLNAKCVVRWLLNRPGYIHGNTIEADSKDLTVTFSRMIDQYLPVLNIQTSEPDIFYPAATKRDVVLCWKGKGMGGFPISGFEITYDIPNSRTLLARALQRASLFITLDCMTALIHEATMCGCPVLVVPNDPRWTKEDFRRNETFTHGVAWGEDEIDYAKATVGFAYDHYKRVYDDRDRQIMEFDLLCTKHFDTVR